MSDDYISVVKNSLQQLFGTVGKRTVAETLRNLLQFFRSEMD